MIEQSTYLLPGPPCDMIAIERAIVDCGCAVYVGKRLDSMEAATGAVPCSAEHAELIGRFNDLLRASLDEPEDAPLITVVDRLLTEAAR